MRKYACWLSLIALVSCHKKDSRSVVMVTPDFKKAENFYTIRPDSAFYYFNKVASASKDSLLAAMALNQMAAIQFDSGDYFGSQESLSQSLHFLNERLPQNRKCLAADYNELGMSSVNLKRYVEAIHYYERALAFSDNPKLQLVILNNIANAYQEDKAYDQAFIHYREVLKRRIADSADYARLLNNIATTQWQRDHRYNAAPEMRKALAIRLRSNDQWGLNSSYIHLSDYYTNSKPDSALYFARQMYRVALQLASPDDQLEALQKLAALSPLPEVRQYFRRYQQLNDSLQTARNAAKNQFALIRYQVEKRNRDNLSLQKDVAEKRYQLFLAALLFVAVAAGLSYRHRKRRRRLQFENQLAIRDHEMRMTKKVHDGVANGIYQLMSEVEHGQVSDSEELADKLDLLYQRSRDISYDQPQNINLSFDQQLSARLLAFGGPNCHISIVGNNEIYWSATGETAQQSLGYVLQELLVNMKKHSRAANVKLKFETEAKKLLISYRDDGVGFSAGITFGNGLAGTENRIQAMGGVITFDGKTGKGLKIWISIPKNRL